MNYNNIVPAGTFIHDYMQHMSETETATDYDFWTALWLISVACGRDVVVARPRAPVYLNLYVILVAESGVTRKSSAVREAASIARDLIAYDPLMGMIDGKRTPEALDLLLAERSRDTGTARLVVAISELATFLGTERYNAHMPALLTDLYDCPSMRSGGGSIGRRDTAQVDVYLSFLSASTPSWLLRSVNPNVVEGGFTSRCMFIVSDTPKKRIAWPSQSRSSQSTQTASLTALRGRVRAYRTITLNEGGLRAFTSWYNRRKFSLDAFKSSFESREDAHVLRVAALLCINDEAGIIQRSHVTAAIKIIEHVKLKASSLFAGTSSRSNFVLGIERIRDYLLLHANEPIPRAQLFLRCRTYVDNAEFTAIIDVLHEMQAVKRYEIKAEGGRGRPTELVQGTKLLASKGMLDKVAERVL